MVQKQVRNEISRSKILTTRTGQSIHTKVLVSEHYDYCPSRRQAGVKMTAVGSETRQREEVYYLYIHFFPNIKSSVDGNFLLTATSNMLMWLFYPPFVSET